MSGLREKRWFRWATEALIVLVVVVGVHFYTTRGAVRGVAPAIQGVTLDGRPVALSQWRGRPVLVHFWATWCPVCKLEQGSIANLARSHAVITVATQSGDAAKVRAWLRAEGLQMPVLLDADGTMAAAWGARGVPASFIIDGGGRIRFVEFGYTTEWGLRLRLWLAKWS